MKRLKLLKRNFNQLLISFDQVLRCIVGLICGIINGNSLVYADETLSAWAYRQSNYYWYANICKTIINVIMLPFEKFQWGHCRRAYDSECLRKHSPYK